MIEDLVDEVISIKFNTKINDMALNQINIIFTFQEDDKNVLSAF